MINSAGLVYTHQRYFSAKELSKSLETSLPLFQNSFFDSCLFLTTKSNT